MRHARLVLALVVVLAASASTAAYATTKRPNVSSSSGSASVAALQKQVADLGAQVKALTAQVTALKAHDVKQDGWFDGVYHSETCLAALTGDALQGTWLLIDKLDEPTLHTTYFGSLSPVDDRGKCGTFKISRSLLHSPPALTGFPALIAWLES